MNCRHCGHDRFIPFADLQNCPPSNAMLTIEGLSAPETFFPLVVEVCENCYLAQVAEVKRATEIFDSEYTYFSSYSSSWLEHCRSNAEAAIPRFGLDESSLVIEVASNDGYLLQFFREAGVPVLGVEPTANTAAVAQDKGIETIVDFFGEQFAMDQLAAHERQADLLIGNNVYAHVPDINDFTAGLAAALKPDGVISLEFPHLLKLIDETQFDTIYHEHFSYLSLAVVERIFRAQNLKVFDVQQLQTHGGSLRVLGTHAANEAREVTDAVGQVLEAERAAGLETPRPYLAFQARVDRVRADFLSFLLEQRTAGKTIVGYGAAAKGNTLLNYAGVKGNELVRYTCDRSPHKQGKFLPGSHIPVRDPAAILDDKPDFVVIFPWNLRTEVEQQLTEIRSWGGQFVVAVPELTVF